MLKIIDFSHQIGHISAQHKARTFNESSLKSSDSALSHGFNGFTISWIFNCVSGRSVLKSAMRARRTNICEVTSLILVEIFAINRRVDLNWFIVADKEIVCCIYNRKTWNVSTDAISIKLHIIHWLWFTDAWIVCKKIPQLVLKCCKVQLFRIFSELRSMTKSKQLRFARFQDSVVIIFTDYPMFY